jgi:GT2 family glycosyltransferase
VIPNWNGKELLSTCLDAVRRQTFTAFETIVVDNGSSDGSTIFLSEGYPEVQVLAFETNRGFSAAVNAGIRSSSGTYVALLNNDVEVESTWLEELTDALDRNPHVSFCASKVLNFYRRQVIDSAGDAFSTYGVSYSIGQGELDCDKFGQQRLVFGACAAAAIYRRAMLEEVGLFDEGFFAYLEDVDLSFRAQLLGHRCLYVPTAVAYHIHGATSRRTGTFPVFLGHRNTVLLLAKDMPARLLVRFLPRLLFVFLGRAMSFARRGMLMLYLKANLRGVLGVPAVLPARRAIMRSRRISNVELVQLLVDAYPRRKPQVAS